MDGWKRDVAFQTDGFVELRRKILGRSWLKLEADGADEAEGRACVCCLMSLCGGRQEMTTQRSE